MNYYERQLEMIKDNMEVERKDISQAFKVTEHSHLHLKTFCSLKL